MYSKEEAKELKLKFWSQFRRYCGKNHIYRKWVLTGVKIKGVQLKFHADNQKALVLFQIDHKNDFRRHEVYNAFLAYRKLMADECGEDLMWAQDYTELDERVVSAIYFELPGVNINRQDDWNTIYAFFGEKMLYLEEAYWEYRDLINERLKHSEDYE